MSEARTRTDGGATTLRVRSTEPQLARLILVYVGILAASSPDTILFRVALLREPPWWSGFACLSALGVLFGLGWALAVLRPLRGYFLALIAFSVGEMLADRAQAALPASGWIARMFANTTIEFIPCALLAISVLGSGLHRGDLFIARGDTSARGPGGVSWNRLGPLLSVVLAGGLAVQLALTVHPDIHAFGRAVAALPLAVAFAAINAAQEEFRFRAVFLARLLPSISATHALLATSLLFGLAHWFGHPSGPTGVVLAGFAGYLWGRSMVDTRGLAWAWLIHGVQDVVIFAFLVAAH